MRNVVLYIAMSLDGYIADAKGGVGWLAGDGSDPDNPGSYPEFIQTIDTVILGYRSYHQVVTELSPQAWVYPDKLTYVITHGQHADTDNIRFTGQDPLTLLNTLQGEPGGDIWICGGPSIIQPLVEHDAIDQYCITVIPTLLGSGIRLFGGLERELPLRLISTRSYNGMTDLVYGRRGG